MKIVQRIGIMAFGVISIYLVMRSARLTNQSDVWQIKNDNTVYFVATEEIYGISYVPLDEYVARCMGATFSRLCVLDDRYKVLVEDIPREVLGDIAIILRTQVLRNISRYGKTRASDRSIRYLEEDNLAKQLGYYGARYAEELYLQVAEETHGLVLFDREGVAEVTYHMLSNGQTRENERIFPWSVAVSCMADVGAESYVTRCFFCWEELRQLGLPKVGRDEIAMQYDAQGYVKSVKWGNMVYSGEGLSRILAIPSSTYMPEWDEKGCTFIAEGIGNGFGMSVYTACELEGEGSNRDEILQIFYPSLICKKIE